MLLCPFQLGAAPENVACLWSHGRSGRVGMGGQSRLQGVDIAGVIPPQGAPLLELGVAFALAEGPQDPAPAQPQLHVYQAAWLLPRRSQRLRLRAAPEGRWEGRAGGRARGPGSQPCALRLLSAVPTQYRLPPLPVPLGTCHPRQSLRAAAPVSHSLAHTSARAGNPNGLIPLASDPLLRRGLGKGVGSAPQSIMMA